MGALLRQAAVSRGRVTSSVGGEKVAAVFLDAAGACSFIGLVQGKGQIENYSLCDGELRKREAPPAPWPDTPMSRGFRQRVVDLALLYGASSGIDPNGFKIRARLTDAQSDACKIAEVSTVVDNALVRFDLLPACPHR